MNWRHLRSQNGFNMTIGDYKKWINSLPTEFDGFEMTHREYSSITDNELNALEMPVYSVHIDEREKKACNMHEASYHLYMEFDNIAKIEVPSIRIPMPNE